MILLAAVNCLEWLFGHPTRRSRSGELSLRVRRAGGAPDSGGPLKLFLDTAHLDDIRTVRDWGLLDGVTTNPSLAAKEGLEFDDLIARICETTPGPRSRA